MARRKIDKGDLQFPPPRELCKRCRNWLTQKDVGFNDFPHCVRSYDYDADSYANQMTDTCPEFLDD